MSTTKQLKIYASLAIFGGLLNAVSDLLLRFGPVSGREITFEYMATMPFEQTLVGAVLGGAIGTPMWLFALVPLYYALRPAGRRYTIPVIVLFAHLFVISAIYHSSFALYHVAYDLFAQAGADGALALAEVKQRILQFDSVFMTFWAFAALIGSIWFGVAVFRHKTSFPRWSVLLTPAMCIPVSILSSLLPAPIGGYIRPMAGSLMMTIFFIVIAQTVWQRREDNSFEQALKEGIVKI